MSLVGKLNDLPIMLQQRHGLHEGVGWILLNDTAETSLTSRLCAHMNSATRKAGGWDFLQFRVEEPDEITSGRRVDLVPAPRAATIWIDGREYTHYASLIPIECKRLPIPPSTTRDEREYLFSENSSTGGVQRFKAGHHGAAHAVGAMIGYIQNRDIDFWNGQIDAWLNELVDAAIVGWTIDDSLRITSQKCRARASRTAIVARDNGRLSRVRRSLDIGPLLIQEARRPFKYLFQDCHCCYARPRDKPIGAQRVISVNFRIWAN